VLPSSIKGGVNYACGGAHASHQYAADKKMYIGVWDQIARFSIDNGGKADPDAAYFILIGGNDLSDKGNPLPFYPYNLRVTPVIKNIMQDLSELQKLGAKNIYVLNQINQFGRESSQGEEWGLFLDYYNNALNSAVANLNKQSNSNIIVYDLSSDFYLMLNKPENYGFANALSPCDSFPAYCTASMRLASAVIPFLKVNPGTPVDAPLIAWFFANIHPTSAGHKFIEVMLRNFIYPPVYD
jgi:phospholipase/lecithinase/hemolysin